MRIKNMLTSIFSRKVIYAEANDEVKIIAVHGEISIVENLKGNRFAVKTSELTDEPIIPIEKPTVGPAAPVIIKQDPAPVATPKAAPSLKQQSLF